MESEPREYVAKMHNGTGLYLFLNHSSVSSKTRATILFGLWGVHDEPVDRVH